MKNKIIDFLDKSVSSQMTLKRIAFYLFLACILLGLIFFKLTEINKNILLATEPIISNYNAENKESVSGIFAKDEFEAVEDMFEMGDTLPIFNEPENTTMQSTTVQNIIETNTENMENEPKIEITTEVSTSSTNNSQKYNFVINVNSSKIHYSDCTFVNRMKEENKKYVQLSDAELKEHLNNGYTLCSTCGG
jgi:hypothetical protein